MPLNLGLSVGDVVNVIISLSKLAAQQRSFGTLLMLGDSGVIDPTTRARLYTGIDAVAVDFLTTSPEYLAAALFFEQNPQPSQLYIGSWVRVDSSGQLIGGALSAAQQTIANFTAVGAVGSIAITVDGVLKPLTGIDLHAVTNLNAVATALTTALAGSAVCVWHAAYGCFQVTSATTGETSAVTFGSVEGAGTDISALMGLQAAQGGYLAPGVEAETPAAAVAALAAMSNNWYGLMFAANTMPSNSDLTAVAQFIEASSVSRIFGITTQDAGSLVGTTSTDIGSLLKALNLNRTFTIYSSSNPYAAATIFGNAFTVNFEGSDTTITIKFKQGVGLAPETLTETQAFALGGLKGSGGKNVNVFVNYNNETAILQNGVMASGQFFDTIHGADWLQNAIQTDVYNELYLAKKVPQTDSGVTRLINRVSSRCEQGRVNGFIAPGVWTGDPVGNLVTGQTLVSGYYVFAPSVASQSTAARSARQSPVMQAAIKLGGAIHSADVLVTVNN